MALAQSAALFNIYNAARADARALENQKIAREGMAQAKKLAT